MFLRWVLVFCITGLITLISTTITAEVVVGRDPTQPATFNVIIDKKQAGTPTAGYQLQSILISKDRSLALINDKFVSVGDVIGSAKVIGIDRNSVILSESGRKLTIYLFDRSIWN